MKRIKNQKSKIVNLLVVMLLMPACGEVEKGQYATDNVPPGQVSNVEHENVPGGAIITYSLPSDKDLLYVKVIYRMSDGTQTEQKSSKYTTKIVVEGLGRAQKQTVQLICGDRSGNESAPYEQEIEPLDAPIYEILESIQISEDFGGIRINWSNPLKENIVLTIFEVDEKNRLTEVQNVYSASSEGRNNIRGYPSEEKTFAVTVRDRWKNTTEMKSGTYIPLFEEKLDRLKFGLWNPPDLPPPALADAQWHLARLWDGSRLSPGWSSAQTSVIPLCITFNMGQMATLSRLKVFQRTEIISVFDSYNVKRFKLYGSPHPNVTADFETWSFLGDFTSVKPSGLPLGQLSDEDIACGINGDDYDIDVLGVPVQYIRIHIMETWGGGMNVAQFMELEFYGQIVNDEQ